MSNSIGKSAIFDASNTTALLALPIVAFISYLIHQTYRGTPGSSKFPRIGKDPHGPFALIVARRDFLRNGARLIEEGYRKVSGPRTYHPRRVRDELLTQSTA